jgi:methionine-rich copper-binding protein CopC
MTFANAAVRVRQFGLGALLAGAALALLATPAMAHSELTSANPPDGSTLTTAPTQVVLTFNENIIAIGDQVSVRDASGALVSDGNPTVVDSTVTQNLKPLAYNGTYAITYRIVSADGHPVERNLSFTLNAQGLPTPTASANPGETTSSSKLSAGVIALIVGGVFLVAVVITVISVLASRGDSKDDAVDETSDDAETSDAPDAAASGDESTSA